MATLGSPTPHSPTHRQEPTTRKISKKHHSIPPTPEAIQLAKEIHNLKNKLKALSKAATGQGNTNTALIRSLRQERAEAQARYTKEIHQAVAKSKALHGLAHELQLNPRTTTLNRAWKLLHEHKTSSAGTITLPMQMRTNSSNDDRLWEAGPIQRDAAQAATAFPSHRYALGQALHDHPASPWNEQEARRITTELHSTNANKQDTMDTTLNEEPTREEIQNLIKLLPPDKSPGPDGISNRLLQNGGEHFSKLIHTLMLTIWNKECYPTAWASALMQPVHKGGGKDRYNPASYRGIYLLNTLTKLFEGLLESRLTPFTELHDTLTHAQNGSRPGRQTHDGIYAHIATIQQRWQSTGAPTYCAYIDFATAYPSVHRERLALLLLKYNITGKIWKLLQENSRRVRVRVLHSLIDEDEEVNIHRGLPEGSRLSPTLFGIFVAELIHELKKEFPHLRFPDITDTDDLSWIGAVLYVDDLVLMAGSPLQLQLMISHCQDWSERSRMQINTEKTKIMVFYETTQQKELRQPKTFHITTRFPTPDLIPLQEVTEFTYLGITLDPALLMHKAAAHACQKINWAHLTIAAVAHSLRHDTPRTIRHTRSCPLILFRLWQSNTLTFATQHLRYLTTQDQVNKVQGALMNSLQRTMRCYSPHAVLMQEFGIPPLKLQQATQLAALHFRYSVTHKHLPAAHLYHLRRQKIASNTHPRNSIESRIQEACLELRLKNTYPGPPSIPEALLTAKTENWGRAYNKWLRHHANDRWHFLLLNALPPSTSLVGPSKQPPSSRPEAYQRIRHHGPRSDLHKVAPYLKPYSPINPYPLLRIRTQCHQLFPTHQPTLSSTTRDHYAERLCNYCTNTQVGNETHILLHCPSTQALRDTILAKLRSALINTKQPPLEDMCEEELISLMCGELPRLLPIRLHKRWYALTLTHILTFSKDVERDLYRAQEKQ